MVAHFGPFILHPSVMAHSAPIMPRKLFITGGTLLDLYMQHMYRSAYASDASDHVPFTEGLEDGDMLLRRHRCSVHVKIGICIDLCISPTGARHSMW